MGVLRICREIDDPGSTGLNGAKSPARTVADGSVRGGSMSRPTQPIRIRPAEAGRLAVVMPEYNAGLVEQLRRITGRQWHADLRYWSVPARPAIVGKLLQIFHGYSVLLHPSLRKLAGPGWLLEAASRELRLHGYSIRTQRVYLQHLKSFLQYAGDTPEPAGDQLVRDYLLKMMENRGLSRSYHNQAVSAIQFLYVAQVGSCL
jgi:hypothetical protein